jgi:ubiquinone/menaquinone biosynthesis C-methylase UbiE
MNAVERTPPTGLRRLWHSARHAERRARWVIEDRRLVREQERVELGPAHRRWRGNSTSENRARWDGWDWSEGGEEWTASPEWKQALIDDVLVRYIPRDSAVLEIGPGGGRWTEALLALASRLVVVDVSERPLELCRRRFAGAGNIEYQRCGGSDLAPVADASIDAVWSFDVFVHVAPADQASYLGELARVLLPGGVAVLHHADGRNRGLLPSRRGWRAPMSRELFAALAREQGLRVERQFDSWGPEGRYDLSAFADAITVCRR